MPIKPVSISFGYKHRLKTEWLRGNIPQLVHDFYDGSRLDPETVTIEHLMPHSKGGRTVIQNIVLTSWHNNMKRGNKDIKPFINPDAARQYIEEARQINIPGINGENYARSLVNKLRSMGVKLYEHF